MRLGWGSGMWFLQYLVNQLQQPDLHFIYNSYQSLHVPRMPFGLLASRKQYVPLSHKILYNSAVTLLRRVFLYKCYSAIRIIIANFYTRFSQWHEAQSAYSVLLPRSLDTFQCRTYSAQFPLPREHSLPGIAAIMALANSNTIICHLLPGPHFIHLGREQQCG